MKKFIFALLLASFTLMGVSCQKETEFVEEEVLSSVYFVAGYDEQPDTKATLQKDESYNKFIWQTGDQIRLYATTTENGKQSYTATLIPESANTSLGTFEASESLVVGSKVNFAAFPCDLSGGTSSVYLEYPAKISEYVSGGLFTPMLAVPAEPIVVAEGETYDDIYFNHVGGALKFTLKSVPAGVNNVVFTATENITGKHFVNTETVSAAAVKDGTWETGIPQEEGTSLTFQFTTLESAQDMVFYVPILADVELSGSLSIVVKASTAIVQTFEKTFAEGKSYTVKRAVVANLGSFDVTNPVKNQIFKQVTLLEKIVPGNYIIVNDGNYLPSTTTTGSPVAVNLGDIKFTDGVYEGIPPVAAVWTFTGTNSAMTVKNDEKQYLYATNNNSGLRVSGTEDSWAFEVNGKGFAMKDKNNSRYCATYQNKDWRSYTTADHGNYSDSGVLYLYKEYDPNAPVVPIISIPETEIDLPATAVAETTFSVTVYDGDVTDVTMTKSSGADWLTASYSAGVLTYSAAENTDVENSRTATLTFSITGGEDVTVTVTQAKGTPVGGVPVGTVLWSETWTDGDSGETPSTYGQEGTTVYNGSSVTYNQNSTSTKLYTSQISAGGVAPELLLTKKVNDIIGTWTISGIPTAGVTSASLTFKSNKTAFTLTTTTENVTISGSDKSWTITFTGSVDTFNLTLANTSTSNARIDDVVLKTN